MTLYSKYRKLNIMLIYDPAIRNAVSYATREMICYIMSGIIQVHTT